MYEEYKIQTTQEDRLKLKIAKDRIIKFLHPIDPEKLLPHLSAEYSYKFLKFSLDPSSYFNNISNNHEVLNDIIAFGGMIVNINLNLFHTLEMWRFLTQPSKNIRDLLGDTELTIKDFKLWIKRLKSKPY